VVSVQPGTSWPQHVCHGGAEIEDARQLQHAVGALEDCHLCVWQLPAAVYTLPQGNYVLLTCTHCHRAVMHRASYTAFLQECVAGNGF
jgi:hypothetical protein